MLLLKLQLNTKPMLQLIRLTQRTETMVLPDQKVAFMINRTVASCQAIKFKSNYQRKNSLPTATFSPRSSPLRDVTRGETSATERQKFHTDDAKSVRNPVISANWSTE